MEASFEEGLWGEHVCRSPSCNVGLPTPLLVARKGFYFNFALFNPLETLTRRYVDQAIAEEKRQRRKGSGTYDKNAGL